MIVAFVLGAVAGFALSFLWMVVSLVGIPCPRCNSRQITVARNCLTCGYVWREASHMERGKE
ncbi:MAG: hypothetical protein M0T85_01885 [Dehalococcoidales bacterium]|nr:hypothetical protein [Dehalococcoidales bacterium]